MNHITAMLNRISIIWKYCISHLLSVGNVSSDSVFKMTDSYNVWKELPYSLYIQSALYFPCNMSMIHTGWQIVHIYLEFVIMQKVTIPVIIFLQMLLRFTNQHAIVQV